MKKLYLASASPRRAELLKQVGIPFEVIAPAVSEKEDCILSPAKLVSLLARNKAENVASFISEGLILAADTVVYCRNQILGKPVNVEDARRMLNLLSGEKHEVITGLVLLDLSSGKLESELVTTGVWMKKLSETEVTAYINTGEPFDKAGAYGIQGYAALFIKRLEGCYFNVVGLPLNKLYEMLQKMQFSLWLSRKDVFDGK
jgi:septum formation protein